MKAGKINNVKRGISLLLMVVILLAPFSQIVFAAWNFTKGAAPAGTVPDYYTETGADTGIYTYLTNDGQTLYRVYGEAEDDSGVEDTIVGFFASDIDGLVSEPYVVLDQTVEAANAYKIKVTAFAGDPVAIEVLRWDSLESVIDRLPKTLEVTAGGAQVSLAVTWECDGIYDENAAADTVYDFLPVLPSDYELDAGVSAPVAKVTLVTPVIDLTGPTGIPQVGKSFGVLNGVSASDQYDNEYTVSVDKITSNDGNYTFTAGDTAFTPAIPGAKYTVYYKVIDEQKPSVVIAEINKVLTVASGEVTIGAMLDGDYAYLTMMFRKDSSTASKKAIYTGTAPWDLSDGDGNDVNEKDNNVRSFDTVVYNVEVQSIMYPDAPHIQYKEGRVFYEFILPYSSDKATFDVDSMGWMVGKKDGVYAVQKDVMVDIAGTPTKSQVLSGNFIWSPAEGAEAAIGSSVMTLSVAVQVLAMKKGETVMPTFTAWLDHNKIGDTIGNRLVACDTHGTTEAVTLTGPAINVSSALRMNVQLKAGATEHNQYKGTFNFTTGNEKALDKDAGMVDGRMTAYGITLQIVGKSGTGLRGCEIPEGDITFDLALTSDFLPVREGAASVSTTKDYAPYVWSFDEQRSGGGQQDNRSMPIGVADYAVHAAPSNKGWSDTTEGNRAVRCWDGGSWSIVKNADGSLSVTVKDYKVDFTKLPWANLGNTTTPGANDAYYTPLTIGNRYWNVKQACFAAGELFVVQPFYDKKGTYILNDIRYTNESGNFLTTIEDKNLMVTSGGVKMLPEVADNTNQTNSKDDRSSSDVFIARPGQYNQYVGYLRKGQRGYGPTSSLTEGCYDKGTDWSYLGGEFNIGVGIAYIANDPENRAVMGSTLVKFDDAAIELTGVENAGGFTGYTNTMLYGVKQDGTGWDHGGFTPDQPGYDDEMIQTGYEDLIFYKWKDIPAGKTVVAVLIELRGLNNTTTRQTSEWGTQARFKTDPSLVNNVYMLIAQSQLWSMSQLNKTDVAAYCDVEVAALTTADYDKYAKEVLPSRAGAGAVAEFAKLPAPAISIVNRDLTPDEITAEYPKQRVYPKARYDASGYLGGHRGSYDYGDSVYIVGYTTGITKNVAQSNTGGTPKVVYDLDSYQRVADYQLQGSVSLKGNVSGSSGTTGTVSEVVVRDILPASGLTLIDGSMYLGGDYTQVAGGKQGKVTGGILTHGGDAGTLSGIEFNGQSYDIPYLVEILDEKDSAKKDIKVIQITYKDVPVGTESSPFYLPTVYYSCTIGTPGDEDHDIANNTRLKNTATITATGDPRPYTIVNGNKAECEILVSKLYAMSVSKLPDDVYNEVDPDTGEGDLGYKLTISNNSANIENIAAVDIFPYYGDGKSSFGPDVDITFTELTLRVAGSTPVSAIDLSTFGIYYTTAPALRTPVEADLDPSVITSDARWIELGNAIDPVTGIVTIPANIMDFTVQPVAVAIVGTLPANAVLKSHITLSVQGAEPGDWFINSMAKGTMNINVHSYFVNRQISGYAWEDANADGIRQDSETVFDGVTVKLYRKVGDAYESAAYKTETTNTNGYYVFDNLPAGTFKVEFTNGTRNLSKLTATIVHAADATEFTNSDGVPTYNVTTGDLEKTVISDIVLPTAREMTSLFYVSRGNDSGFYSAGGLEISKTVSGKAPVAGKTFTFAISLKAKDQKDISGTFACVSGAISGVTAPSYTSLTFVNGTASIQLAHGQKVTIPKLPIGATYTVTESDYGSYTVKANGADSYETSGTIAASPLSKAAFDNYMAPGPVDLVLEGNKTFTGGGKTTADITAGQFSFTVAEDAANDTTGYSGLPSGAVYVKAGGAIDFGTLTFTKSGTYKFVFSEETGTEPRVTYDNKPVTVTVIVAYSALTDALGTTVTYSKNGGVAGGITFNNTYSTGGTDPDPDSTRVVITGTKRVQNGTLKNGQFEFGVFDGSTRVATGTNDADGRITFSEIVYTTVGNHTYTVRETSTSGNGWTVDTTEYTIRVNVTLNSQNKLSAQVVTGEELIFTNKFSGNTAYIQLTGTKTAQGAALTNGQFTFAVYSGSSVVATGSNDANGKITFSEIVYSDAGTYTYTVRETSVGGNGWSTDKTVYTVTVNVVKNSDGTLTATLASNAPALSFHNIYTPGTPGGDTVSLIIRKLLTGADGNPTQSGKQFAVQLYDANRTPIGRYILTANSGQIEVTGLKPGATYYLAEETSDTFTLLGYEVLGIGSTTSSSVGIHIPNSAGNISVTVLVKNQTIPGVEITDEEPPLSPPDLPENPPVLDIPEEKPPLSPITGETAMPILWVSLMLLSLFFAVYTFAKQKKGN